MAYFRYFRIALSSILAWITIAQADEVHVAVGANFASPMKLIAAEFEKETGHKIVLSYGTVGKFYAQIKNGAPFEVLVSSDQETPDKLVADGLALETTRRTYAIGRLVLWSAKPGFVDPNGEVLKKGEFRHLAIANPKLAVYGAAAQETLKRMGLWETLAPRIVQAENITQAHQFVASGNAELGFVALSQVIDRDGRINTGSHWLVPADLYPRLRQDVIVLARGRHNPAAAALVDYLVGSKARAIIKSYGYGLE
ncbi:MAG: molybdate ABC transporter substrate-binding protein [Rhodocyclaceae bacterium]|nr:molybdate ABC transporter substrate-binding protein [Rhodocyclaceae bacterium]